MTQVKRADFLCQHVTGNTYMRHHMIRISGNSEITVPEAGPVKAELRHWNC